jgi:hypothetical protein
MALCPHATSCTNQVLLATRCMYAVLGGQCQQNRTEVLQGLQCQRRVWACWASMHGPWTRHVKPTEVSAHQSSMSISQKLALARPLKAT